MTGKNEIDMLHGPLAGKIVLFALPLAASSMLHEIYGTSGKSHIHAIGVAPNSETLGNYANYLYRTTRGIRELNWQILVTTYKDTERGVAYERYQESQHLEEGGAKNTES